jgi:SpoVK/Ycf46/Vps4 family AAA+-type ATPase
MTDPLIASLTAAVEAQPDDLPLRLHLAELLLAANRSADAIGHLGRALQVDPANEQAQRLMATALGGGSPDVNWKAYEAELSDIVPPRFADSPDASAVDVERSELTLADVGGMAHVKERLELAFLAPMRNAELRRLYGKRLRGGLLLYGPPGCGKTFLARAVAGEMGAHFISVSIVDVLNMWIGNSERNLHEIFEAARRNSPCVLFLDEIDAIGHKRSNMHSSSMRTLANQLLAEMDGVDSANDGVFILAATNAPWDVDAALRRPGRLDRMVLVSPPDASARTAILQYHLRQRPIANIRLDQIVSKTEDFSGADLAHLCESAAEFAMHDSISSQKVRMIEQRDFDRALREIKPSVGGWFATARNVALFANEAGVYDELAEYMKKRRLI